MACSAVTSPSPYLYWVCNTHHGGVREAGQDLEEGRYEKGFWGMVVSLS